MDNPNNNSKQGARTYPVKKTQTGQATQQNRVKKTTSPAPTSRRGSIRRQDTTASRTDSRRSSTSEENCKKNVTSPGSQKTNTSHQSTPPSQQVVLKQIQASDLKPGDILLILHHSVPKNNSTYFHWMIYFHFGPDRAGEIIHATFFKPHGSTTDYWKFEKKAHTLITPKLAYARVLGNMNVEEINKFTDNFDESVPVPFLPRDPHPSADFTCRIWAKRGIRYMSKIKKCHLHSSIDELEAEMKAKACAQEELARRCCKMSEDNKPIFQGYIPLIEKYSIVMVPSS